MTYYPQYKSSIENTLLKKSTLTSIQVIWHFNDVLPTKWANGGSSSSNDDDIFGQMLCTCRQFTMENSVQHFFLLLSFSLFFQCYVVNSKQRKKKIWKLTHPMAHNHRRLCKWIRRLLCFKFKTLEVTLVLTKRGRLFLQI